MAEDLTPPRPAVDVEPWTPTPTHHHADEAIVEHVAVRQRSYGGRFALAYGLLGIVAGFALAALVITTQLSSPEALPKWSAWIPTGGSSTEIATQIADHVSPAYMLPNGRQLVAVTASIPKFQGVQLAAVAVEPQKSAVDQNIRVVDASKTIQYVMCGLGKECSIATGKPSVEREWLLRREAFELALYTFQYDPGVDTVLAFLPPPPGKSPDVTMFFERANYEKELSQPLTATIPAEVPPLKKIPIAEGNEIDKLTAPQRYGFQIQQLQDGSPVIVLNAVSPA
ncbi:MAG: hypothetical protein ACR2JV_03640 [Gaiellales bacterium]